MRGVRRADRHRAAEGAPGHHALHRLQVAPGSRGAPLASLVKRPRKAVIPAAGLGTRFLPATKAVPKEMLPVVDTPAIEFVVAEAARAGIDDVLLITSRAKKAIEDHFDAAPEVEQALVAKGDDAALARVQRSTGLAHVHAVRQ